MNALRTHYTPSQRAMFAAAQSRRPTGVRANQKVTEFGNLPTIASLARQMGVGVGPVIEAKRITRDAAPEVAERLSWSLNALRTHYTPSQRAMLAAGMATRPHGDQRTSTKRGTRATTIAEAAVGVGVAKSYVISAKRVLRDAAPEVAEAVKAGKLTLHAATAKRVLRDAAP